MVPSGEIEERPRKFGDGDANRLSLHALTTLRKPVLRHVVRTSIGRRRILCLVSSTARFYNDVNNHVIARVWSLPLWVTKRWANSHH